MMNLKRYAVDPAAFRADLIVDVDGQAKRFSEVMDEWQREDFASLDPALMVAAGRSSDSAKTRAFLERPRGHSKTTDIAVIAVWTMTFAARPIRGYCYAADKDQARLLRDAVATLIRLNPWLADILVVEANRVVTISGPADGSRLTIEASDVGSSYGILPDLIIADELCHWQGDGSLWHSLISSAAKRSNCLLCVITNAGSRRAASPVASVYTTIHKQRSKDAELTFEFTVTVKDNRDDGLPNFLGPLTHGPTTGRFIYINIGKSAGQFDSCWDRRLKIPLGGITWEMIEKASTKMLLEARLPGTGKDGGPSCATVKPIEGWKVCKR